MPVKFRLTITPPKPEVQAEIERLLRPARNFDALVHLLRPNLAAAAAIWGGCFNSDEVVDIEVTFQQTDKRGADTASKGSVELKRAPRRYSDKHLIMEGAAAQIAGCGKPDRPGIGIALPVNTYLTEEVWFDPKPAERSLPVPAGLVDGVTLFLHEMGHGLGFNGRLRQGDGRPEKDEVSRYDEWVEFDGSNFFFHGPSALAQNGGNKVPLGDGRHPNNDYTHVGNDAGSCAACRTDLMTAYPWETGRRHAISPLDLAILTDVGLPVA